MSEYDTPKNLAQPFVPQYYQYPAPNYGFGQINPMLIQQYPYI